MRIISPFKDYYDCIQKYGQDDIEFIRYTVGGTMGMVTHLPNNSYNCGYVVFCGKVYPYVTTGLGLDLHHHYDIKSLMDLNIDVDCRLYFTKISIREFMSLSSSKVNTTVPIYVYSHYRDWRNPVKLTEDQNCVINPMLSSYDFQKVFDPYQAYQELSMFIGNQCLGEPEIIEVSDKVKSVKYGHDGKYSFKTPKGGICG